MRPVNLKSVLILTALIFLASAAVSHASISAPKAGVKKQADIKASKEAAARTVFDMAHAEIFSPVKEGELNYTAFYESFKSAGEAVSISQEPITDKRLSGVKTYVIAGPSQPFQGSEIDALRAFVKRGGNLLVLLHISGPVAALTNSFGIIVSNYVIGEQEGIIEGRTQDFHVTRFGGHPVTKGLEKIAFYGAWGLMTEGEEALVVAGTSARAWADVNRNRAYEKDEEPAQEFGMIAVAELGKGKVVVVGDDAPFANKFIGEADNRKLAENIIKWFK